LFRRFPTRCGFIAFPAISGRRPKRALFCASASSAAAARDSKALLAAAPLEGIDLGRDVEL
jgi:hypothetical protein